MPTKTLYNRKVYRINDHQQRTNGWQSRTIDKQELQKGRKAAHYYYQLTLNFHLRRKVVPLASICINPTPSVFARIRSTRNFQLFFFAVLLSPEKIRTLFAGWKNFLKLCVGCTMSA